MYASRDGYRQWSLVEVDDVRRAAPAGTRNKHAADPDFASYARGAIFSEVVRPGSLELKRQPLSHHAGGVDRIHECLGIRHQQIPRSLDNHRSVNVPSSGRP
jgi:hypothetical protein